MSIWNAAALCSLMLAAAADVPEWKDWSPMIGAWEADRSADGATGSFTLSVELQGRILLRKNRADYPGTKERPAAHHEDLMVIWRDGSVYRAEYWDNEGHLIRYVATVEPSSKTFTFLSEAVQGQPRYRLKYVGSSANALSLRFEIAPPNAPDQFKNYITASVHRVR